MAKKIEVLQGDRDPIKYCELLEEGNILFFPTTPFPFPQEEIDFLLKQRQSGSAARKNIAYKPSADKITNHESEDAARLLEIMRNYSQRVTQFLGDFLEPYKEAWKLDYASFRPFQEKGRKLRTRARNDLLHVDAFPTRPMHGTRILRFFTNINPSESRIWRTSKDFAELAKEFGDNGVHFPKAAGYSLKDRLAKKMKQMLHLPMRSPYDSFMLKMHNFLKENDGFQKNCPKDQWEFPPNSCWAVFTDQVSHAAMAGQYALEQTFLVPQNALLCPEKSPIGVIERLSGRNVSDQELLAKMFAARR